MVSGLGELSLTLQVPTAEVTRAPRALYSWQVPGGLGLGSEVFEIRAHANRCSGRAYTARQALVHNAELLGRRVRVGHRQEHWVFLVQALGQPPA